jgi:hypothetical protein
MASSTHLHKPTLTVVALLALSLLGVRSSDASTISWLYTGSVVSSFNNALVPVGSPATIVLSVDPANNFAAGGPGVQPNAGGYLFDAGIDFTGRHYNLHGAFEINEDLVFDQALPGDILLRYLTQTGPSLDPSRPLPIYSPYPLTCGYPCAFSYPGGADPTSPAFPGPLTYAAFPLYFYDVDGRPEAISVLGTDPAVVPEPASGLLLLTGAIVLVQQRRRASANRRR